MTASEAFDRLQQADMTWRALLDLQFGPLAFDARHNPEGRGQPGTKLRGAWKAREAALRAYHAAVNAAVGA